MKIWCASCREFKGQRVCQQLAAAQVCKACCHKLQDALRCISCSYFPPQRPLLPANLKALKQQAPAVVERLQQRQIPVQFRTLNQSLYLATQNGSYPWLEQSAKTGQPVLAETALLLVCGSYDGQVVQAWLAELGPDAHVFLIEPCTDIWGEQLGQQDWHQVLQDSRLTVIGDGPEQLARQLSELSSQQRDLSKTALYIHQGTRDALKTLAKEWEPTLQILEQQLVRAQSLMQPQYRQSALNLLYQQVARQQSTIAPHYNYSCKNGCDACCQGSPGSTIFISPVEWEYLYEHLLALDAPVKNSLFWKSTLFVSQRLDQLSQYQQFLSQHTIQLMGDDPETTEYHALTKAVKLGQCPFLGSDHRCSVYQGRPMICRIFGWSYWGRKEWQGDNLVEHRLPYTCHLDFAAMKQHLVMPNTPLLEAHQQFQHVAQLHAHFSKGNILPNWLAIHLDLEHLAFHKTSLTQLSDFSCLQDPQKIAAFKSALQTALAQRPPLSERDEQELQDLLQTERPLPAA